MCSTNSNLIIESCSYPAFRLLGFSNGRFCRLRPSGTTTTRYRHSSGNTTFFTWDGMAANVSPELLYQTPGAIAHLRIRSGSKDAELERTYAALLKQSSPHEKSIQRDLGRTFPHHSFFMDGHGIGQESLFNVLKAYSLCVCPSHVVLIN